MLPQKIHPIKLLETTFQLRLSNGKLVPFKAEEYQRKFFAKGPLMGEHKTRVVSKSRKLGFTMLWLMESVTLANQNDYTFYPFAATTETQSYRAVSIAEQLIEDAKIDFSVKKINSDGIKFNNGSEIAIFTGSSPESARGPQAYSACLDEFAFNIYQDELLAAFSPMLVQGGQLTVLSTPNGVNNRYWKMVTEAKSSNNYAYLEQPIFKNMEKFDITRSIPDQVEEGLELVSWWIDPYKLEQDRLQDPVLFLQEYCCQAAESSYALFNRDKLEDMLIEGEFEYAKDGVSTYFTGSDFALSTAASGDFSVTAIMKHLNGQNEIVRIERSKGNDTPTQVKELKNMFGAYLPVDMKVEDNNFGRSVFDYLKKEVPVVSSFHTSEPSKKSLIRQLQNVIDAGQIKIRRGRTPEERKLVNTWLSEMLSFSRIENKQGTNYKLMGAGNHDDCVIATGIALQALIEWQGGLSSKVVVRSSPNAWGPGNISSFKESDAVQWYNRKREKKEEPPLRLSRMVKW